MNNLIAQAFEFDFLIDIFERFQTFIAAIIAFAAVAWTVSKMNQQIRLQSEQLTQERARHRAAWISGETRARAILPGTLVELCDYSQSLMEQFTQRGTGTIEVSALPAFPTNARDSLIDVMQFIDDEPRQALRTIVQDLQVLSSRIASRYGAPRRWDRDRMYDIVKFHAYCDRVWPFARHEESEISVAPLSCKEMIAAMRISADPMFVITNRDRFTPLSQLIESRHELADEN